MLFVAKIKCWMLNSHIFEIRIRPENFLSEHKFYQFSFEKTILQNKLCKCSFEENFQCQSDNLFIDRKSSQKRKKKEANQITTKSFETDFFVYDFVYKVISKPYLSIYVLIVIISNQRTWPATAPWISVMRFLAWTNNWRNAIE